MSNDNPFHPPNEEDFHDHPPKQYHEGLGYVDAREVWPLCTRCGKRVDVICPFCKNVDNLFPLGDSTYWTDDLGNSLVDYQKNVDQELSARSVLFGEGDTSIPEPGGHGGCHCGSGGCGSEDEPEESWFTVDDPPLVLMCPTCADVFVPDFPSECLHCRLMDDLSPGENDCSTTDDESPKAWESQIALEEPHSSGWILIVGFLLIFAIVFSIISFVF